MALQQPAANTLARSLSIAGTLASPSSKKQAAGGTLNTVLARRLRDALPKLRPLAESQSESELLTQLANLKLDADLPYIKALTVKASMFTLRTMRRALDAVAASTRSEGDVPPLLGSKDMHVVGMLIAIIARWGLAACVEPGVLPDTMRDDLLGGEGRQEAIEELPDVPLLELDALVKEVIELGAPSEGPSTSTAVPNPLPELISTRTHICIVAALLQIKHNGKAGSEWASEQLSIILQRCIRQLVCSWTQV